MGGLTHVSVNFETSHLIFPTLIGSILALLGLAILIVHRREIAGSGAMWRAHLRAMDRPRFFGTLGLVLVYFLAMVPVGDVWPNTGLGFLLCSIPFVFLSGLLFMHDRSAKPVAVLALVALIAPSLVWWLFTNVFSLTLP